MRLPLQSSGPFWVWSFLLSAAALTQVVTSTASPRAGGFESSGTGALHFPHDGRRSLPQLTEDDALSAPGSGEQQASKLSRAKALVAAVQREVRSRNAEIVTFAQKALRDPVVGSGSPSSGWGTPAIPVLHINKTVADAAALVSESLARTSNATTAAAPPLVRRQQRDAYWMEEMDQNGRSPFVTDSDYKVWRNVRDYGARGDGVRDDTEAIMRAVRDGNRCGKECGSSSTLQAVVYFPSGTYLVSSSIVQYYLTQFVGDATDPPTIKASPAFVGLGVISTNVYDEADGGKTWYIVQSNFFRQVRNFVIDISEAPLDQYVAAIHWQVGQATSLENIKFKMSTSPGNNQQGIFMESGSGGFLSNLEFDGGAVGAYVGNQQFTVRGLSFSNHQVAAIHIHWSWGWTWKGVEISRCPVGVLMLTPNAAPGVGSAIFLDSAISDTNVGFRLQDPTDDARITLSLFNLNTSNVPVVVEYASGRVLLPGSGGEASVAAWGVGKRYDAADGEAGGEWQDGEAYARVPTITDSLLQSPGNNRSGFFERSKPQYTNRRAADFLNVKKFPFNAAGDGTRDDTFALNLAMVFASASGMIVWVPAGVYRVTDTVHIPRGAKVVGQSWSQIMGTGEKFQDAEKPRAVVRVGNIGDVGDVEIQDLVFTVRGPAAGAVLLQWNIHEQSPGSAAMWDTHIRVGGQAGSDLQAGDCPKNTGSVNPDCIAAALLVHITSEASAYFENAWFWVADHDLDIPEQTQIDVYVARGVLVESIGPVWLYGTGSEHCVLYQYQTVNAANVFMGMIQSESPYFQPVPKAPAPFAAPSANFSSDPRFGYCADSSATCAVSWGLRFINSQSIYLYGAGVYSFFSGYDQACVEREDCQDRIIEVETSSDVWMFSLVTKAAVEMISPRGGVSVRGADNKFNFCSIVMAWLGSALERRGISGVRYGSPRSATVVPFLSTTLAPSATLTVSGPVLSHLSTAVNDGFQNRPPGPGADLCRNCDLLRLLTSTCCGTGGNTSNPFEVSPGVPLPRALVLPPGFIVNQQVRDNRGKRYPAGQPLPVEVVIPGGTVFLFPLVIEPGVGLTNATSVLDDENENDNSTLFIVRDFWQWPEHTVSCIVFPCVINFPPVTTTSTWILPPLTTTIDGEERSTTLPPVTTHVIRISRATVDEDDSSTPTIVPVPVPEPVCVEMDIPLLGPLPIGVCPPAIEPVPPVPIVTVVPAPPGTLPGPVIPGNKPTSDEEDPDDEDEEEEDEEEEEEEICFWSGLDEPEELDFSGGGGGDASGGNGGNGGNNGGAGTGRPTTSTRTVTPRPTTSRTTSSTAPEEPAPPPTEPPPEPTQEPPKPDPDTEESTCFKSGRQVLGGTVQDALNNFCDWADGQTIEKNGFLQASEPGDFLSGVAVGVVGKNNCRFRIGAADCKRILNKVVGCRPGGSLLRIGGKVESNCATWTLDPYEDLHGDCIPIPNFLLLCELIDFFAP